MDRVDGLEGFNCRGCCSGDWDRHLHYPWVGGHARIGGDPGDADALDA